MDDERWKQIAVEIVQQVHRAVNSPETVGGDHETGVALLFFNTKHHNGLSTCLSTVIDRAELKKLLKTAAANLGKGTVINPGRAN